MTRPGEMRPKRESETSTGDYQFSRVGLRPSLQFAFGNHDGSIMSLGVSRSRQEERKRKRNR